MRENYSNNFEVVKLAAWEEYITESSIDQVHKDALLELLRAVPSQDAFLFNFAEYLRKVIPNFSAYDSEVKSSKNYGTAISLQLSGPEKELYDLFSDIRSNRWDGRT
jgi:hypothetical protein